MSSIKHRSLAAPSFCLPLVAAACLGACAHAPPPELSDARQTFRRASAGPAARLAPTELHDADEALRDAEHSFKSSPEGPVTRDLAYVAARKALLAELRADTQQAVQRSKGELARTQQALAQAEQGRQQSAAEAEAERQARLEAEQRASTMLARLAAVKQEARGLVITLSGSVLFRSDEAALLPAARQRLDQVAEALLSTKERTVQVEGYTDSRGKDDHNVALSQRRAEAVRAHLVARGYPADRIRARGLGKEQPVADNGSAEGRANNRRVEIVIAPQGEARRE